MPRIIKETIKLIPSKKSLKIYKKSNSQNYYCSFYIGRLNSKSGNKEQSLKTPNVKVALKEAIKTYDLVIANQQHQQLKNLSVTKTPLKRYMYYQYVLHLQFQ